MFRGRVELRRPQLAVEELDPVTPKGASTKIDTCTDQTVCTASVPAPSSGSAPRQSTLVTGTPSDHVGAVVVTSTRGRLGCKSISGNLEQSIAKLKNTGFSSQTKLEVTLTSGRVERAIPARFATTRRFRSSARAARR